MASANDAEEGCGQASLSEMRLRALLGGRSAEGKEHEVRSVISMVIMTGPFCVLYRVICVIHMVACPSALYLSRSSQLYSAQSSYSSWKLTRCRSPRKECEKNWQNHAPNENAKSCVEKKWRWRVYVEMVHQKLFEIKPTWAPRRNRRAQEGGSCMCVSH